MVSFIINNLCLSFHINLLHVHKVSHCFSCKHSHFQSRIKAVNLSKHLTESCVIFTVHGVSVAGQQPDQRPEGVLFVHVDEQQRRDLTHALTVAHLLRHTRVRVNTRLWFSLDFLVFP